MTDEELFVFSEKLATWGEQLTPKERAFLLELLSRAIPNEPGDVQGHMSHAFLKLGDLQGERSDDRHEGEIDVLAVRWGVTPPPTRRRRQ
jgi:hypothetical protein